MNAGPLSLYRHDTLWPISKLTMADLVRRVAEKHQLALDDLRGPSRTQRVCEARQEAMWECAQTGRWSNGQIGRFLNRTNWTVLYNVRVHEARQTNTTEAA